MIARATGEITFAEGVVFTPLTPLVQEHLIRARAHHALSIAGWTLHLLGQHESDHGLFEVQAVSDPICRITTVLLAHAHPFYDEETPDDAERRAFHEGILEADLGELRQFSWGEVFCQVDGETKKDWIAVVYQSGPKVPLRPPIAPRLLRAYAPLPELNLPEPEDDPFFVPKPAPRS